MMRPSTTNHPQIPKTATPSTTSAQTQTTKHPNRTLTNWELTTQTPLLRPAEGSLRDTLANGSQMETNLMTSSQYLLFYHSDFYIDHWIGVEEGDIGREEQEIGVD
jgi:hypothetical protein